MSRFVFDFSFSEFYQTNDSFISEYLLRPGIVLDLWNTVSITSKISALMELTF